MLLSNSSNERKPEARAIVALPGPRFIGSRERLEEVIGGRRIDPEPVVDNAADGVVTFAADVECHVGAIGGVVAGVGAEIQHRLMQPGHVTNDDQLTDVGRCRECEVPRRMGGSKVVNRSGDDGGDVDLIGHRFVGWPNKMQQLGHHRCESPTLVADAQHRTVEILVVEHVRVWCG